MSTKLVLILIALAFGFLLLIPGALAQDQCVPFGGTIYGWHNGNSW
jgi:hypothetical protein